MPKATMRTTTPTKPTKPKVTAKAISRPRRLQRFINDPAELQGDYAMYGDGNCMSPEFNDGSKLVFTSREQPEPGDIVIIWRRPESTPPGELQAIVKRLVSRVPHWVKAFPFKGHPESEVGAALLVEQNNPRRSFAIDCEHVLALHKFVAVQS